MFRKTALLGALCVLGAGALAGVAQGACTPDGIRPIGLQAVTVSAATNFTLSVLVVDANHQGCPGATVTFTAPAAFTAVGSPTVVSQESNGSLGAAGAAQATFTAPPYNGTFTQIMASVVAGSGTAQTVSFTVSVTGGANYYPGTGVLSSSIVPITTTAPTVAPGNSVTVGVQVWDSTGNLADTADNIYVNFQGTGLTLTTANPVLVTNGYAYASFVTPSTAGTYYINVSGYNTPLAGATFTVYVGTSGGTNPGSTGGVSIVSGNGQVVGQGSPTLRPLVVQVKDTSTGTPIQNAVVSWVVTSGAGPNLNCYLSVSCTSSYVGAVSTATDANGMASINAIGALNVTAGTYGGALLSTITASTGTGTATFYLTTVPTTSGGLSMQVVKPTTGTITAKAGATVADAIEARAGSGFLSLSNVGLDVSTGNTVSSGPTATCSGGTALTDATGLARCDLVVGSKTGTATLTLTMGGSATQTLVLEVTPGEPSDITIAQGDNQTGNAGQTLPLALVGVVKDAGGNPLPGVAVQWSVDNANAISLATPTSSATDVNGRASTRVKLGSTPGTFKVTMTAGSASKDFSVTVNAALGPLQKVSGDLQTAVVGTAFAQPVVVQVKDESGAVIPGIGVTFSATGGTVGTPNATTDASGNASTTVTAGSSSGAVQVTATVGSQTATFNLIARLPGPTLTADSFKNGAGFQTGVVAGSIVTIQGAGVAPGITGCVGSGTIEGPLPTSLGGDQVLFGTTAAPIYSVCNTNGVEQVSVQAPFDLSGSVSVTVKVQGGSTNIDNVPVLPAQPGIFQTQVDDGRLYGVVIRPDGSFVSPGNPANRGEVVQLYVTGLGPVQPAAATNHAGVPGQNVFYPVIVGVNNAGVRVVSATYAENLIGVYMISFEVPESAPAGGDLPLSVAVSTGTGQPLVYSNPSRIAVQ